MGVTRPLAPRIMSRTKGASYPHLSNPQVKGVWGLRPQRGQGRSPSLLTFSPFHVASVFRAHYDAFAGFDEGWDEGFYAVGEFGGFVG